MIATALTHALFEQKSPAMQSVCAVQLVLHAPEPQTYGVHAIGAPGAHVPEPLQLAVLWDPPAHDVVQSVPEGQSAHAPALHLPSRPQLVCAVAAQRPRGSVVPLVAALQVPSAPPVSAPAQAWHAPVHAMSQRTPSTQKPLWHWSVPVHAAPGIPCATQENVEVSHQ